MNIAVVLAGGNGTRMGVTEKPKQFIEICGKPVVIHTLEAFEKNEKIDAVCLICAECYHGEMKNLLNKYSIKKVRWMGDAGETRQLSSRNALDLIKDECNDEDIIIIHDAARPLISQRIIDDNIRGVEIYGGCDTVIPSHDTIIRSLDGETLNSIPVRKELYLGQTPQSFRYGIVRKAYDEYYAMEESARPVVTDDCGLVLFSGAKIGIVAGDKLNMKLTTSEDLCLIEFIMKTRE